MRIEHMIGKILELYDSVDRGHGTTNGVRTCGARGNELEHLKQHGNACSHCVARERLDLIEKALEL